MSQASDDAIAASLAAIEVTLVTQLAKFDALIATIVAMTASSRQDTVTVRNDRR